MVPTFNEILREAVFGTLSDRRGILGYGVLTSALLAAASAIDRLGGIIFGATFGAMIALVIIFFYWQRRYLLGPEFDPVRMRLLGGYFWRAVLLFVVFYALAFILSSPFFPEDYWSEDYYNDVVFDETVPIIGLFACPLTILSGRLLLVFPSIAVDRSISWKESWKLAGNRGFHLGIVIVLLSVPSLAFESLAPSAFQNSTAGIVAYSMVSSFLSVFAMLMALTASAFLYKSTARTTTST